jgi:hypothetical protein
MLKDGTTKLFFVILTILFCFLSVKAQNYYYLCTYVQEDIDSLNVRFLKIDLDRKEIVLKNIAPLWGELNARTPLTLLFNSHQYYVVMTIEGAPGKNSRLSPTLLTHYIIFNENGDSIHSGCFSGIHMYGFEEYTGQSIYFKYYDEFGQSGKCLKGSLSLSDTNNLIFGRLGEYQSTHPGIGRFRYPQRITPKSDKYYWDLDQTGLYLFSRNLPINNVFDSLVVDRDIEYSYLFGIPDSNTMIYLFYLNYNELGGPESLQKINMDSSYLKIINPQTLVTADSIYVQNPSLDSGYAFAEIGTCDRVGPYFVYYFFDQEDYRYYSPAMLFIFDTRNNQATWLRVGWR